nr:copper amine oxidase N-terminal domain-containing protein [Bacillus benzoevorans]
MILITSAILLLFGLSFGVTVMADDDEHEREDHGKYEGYEKQESWKYDGEEKKRDHEDHEDDDDEYEYKENNQIGEYNSYVQSEQTGYWNIWTREVVNHSSTALPVLTPSTISLTVNNKPVEIYGVPQNGQLLVSAEKLAEKLGAEAKVYTISKIVKVTKGENELIIRSGSNAAYENSVKTPMPAEAVYYEKSVYIPICVLANALGYRIDWAEAEQKINLVSI